MPEPDIVRADEVVNHKQQLDFTMPARRHGVRCALRMDKLRQDLAYAVRRLVKAPAFTLIAVATLALGIGANSAIFSVVSAVLLRPLPYDEPDRLVQVAQTWQGKATGIYSPQNFLDVAAEAQSFESMAAIDAGGITLTGNGAAARVEGAEVSASFFEVLRARPALGRGFEPNENEPGHAKATVLGHELWRSRFGADPGLVGRTVQLNREPYLVVGVAPKGFAFPEGAQIWTPIEYDPRFRSNSRGAWYLGVIARLKPGASVMGAREEVATIAARLAREYPEANEGVGGTVTLLHETLVGRSRPALLVLLGAVGLVLLIACVNVANLLLARMAARETELAVRSALGAGRGRLMRQLLTESVVLAALGGLAGLLLASLFLDSLLALQPEGVARIKEVRIDRAVVAFSAALSLATGLLFGVFPALQVTRGTTAPALREAGRGVLSGRGSRLRAGLVVGQMALAMVLLAGAGLLVRSFYGLVRVDPGFRPESALTFRLSLPEQAYPSEERRAVFFDEVLTRLAALPAVRSTAAVTNLPLGGTQFNISFEVAGRPPAPPAQQPSLEVRVATAGYFELMGIPIRRGRRFERRDGPESPQVVVLNESAVEAFFSGEDPLGKRITLGLGREEGKPRPGGEVVGIVGDVRERSLSQKAPPTIYLPYAQLPFSSMNVLLRSAVPPRTLVPAVEAAVHGLDPELPVAGMRTLEEVVGRSVSEPRFYTILLGIFAVVALLLSALGIFGVLSFAVVQRHREIGIRVALGAHPADVLRMVLGRALGLVALGVSVGLFGALALSRTVRSLLFNLSPTDPATFGAVAVLLTLVALLASYLPARRATRVDPLEALRSE
jgi:putative ABC transport system permease protein